jgi:hypothetical protein
MPPVQQDKEVGLAVPAGGNQLAVNDARFYRKPKNGRGDAREAAGKVAAIATEDRGGDARFVQLHPVAVEFQLIQPSLARRRRCSQLGKGWTNEGDARQLRSLRDMAKSAGQLSAAISAEVKRGELRRFDVKQIEPAHVNDFSHMSDEELERFIREPDALIRSMEPGVPPTGVHNPNGRFRLAECSLRRGAGTICRTTTHNAQRIGDAQAWQVLGQEETCGDPSLWRPFSSLRDPGCVKTPLAL